MSRCLWAGIALLLACTAPALAQFWPVTPLAQAGLGSSSYVGPGDVVSGAAAWYGLRGYSAAYSTGSNPAVNIRRASDSHTCDLLVTSAGAIGNTANCSTGGDNGQSAASFAGTAATCTGTISGTTMSISSCASGTLGQNEQVTGSGIVGPTFISSIGTCASPPGTCTLQVSQTVGSPVTITASVGLSVTTFYDQSGANLCSSAPCNITQTTGGNQPIFLSSCVGTAPCLGFLSATPNSLVSPVTSPLSTSSVITMSIVAQNQNNVATYGSILGVSVTGEIGLFGNSANTVTIYAGSTTPPTATASDLTTHALQYIFNGATSYINVDGAASSTGDAGAFPLSTPLNMGTANTANFYGLLMEAGLWSGNFTSGNNTSMCHNQRGYWSTPGSC